jgi:hypothetical protein
MAMKQGFAFSDYRSFTAFQALILDSRTKLALAKESIFFRDASKSEAALEQVEAVETIWKQQFQGDCSTECIWTVEKALVTLGVVKGPDDFRAYIKNFGMGSDQGVMATGLLLGTIVSLGMTTASTKIEAVEVGL